MILVMVLGFFLVLSGLTAEEFWSAREADLLTSKVYLKEQAYYHAISAFKAYLRFLKNDDSSFDSLNDDWASPLEFSIPEGRVKITVVDEERYINLNLVQKEDGFKVVKRLFEILKISSLSPETLRTWVTGAGFWDRPYPPKRAVLESPEELRFLGMSTKDFYGKVEGFEFYPGISQVATVLSSGRVNLNTAPPEVIMSLCPQIDRTLAEKLVKYRQEKSFKKIEDVLMVDGFNFEILHELRKWATVKSENFKIIIDVRVGDVEGELESVVKRTSSGFKVLYWRYS